MYFFAYLAHAEWWVTHERYKNRKTAILQAQLTYTDEQLLDLDDPEEIRKINLIFQEAVSKRDHREPFFMIENPKKEQKQCFACNLIRKICPEIGIIVHTFPKDIDHNKISLYRGNERQMCVSKQSIISDIKEVNSEDVRSK